MGLLVERQTGQIGLLITDEDDLRRRSRKVGTVDGQIVDIATQMKETALDWEKRNDGQTALAVAAMQIGHLYKLCIIRSNPKDKTEDFQVYVNPKIVKTEGEPVEMLEGCLSIPHFYAKVTRPSKIRVRAHNAEGQLIKFKCDGLLARILQHEIDHFDGKLFTDYVDRADWIHVKDLATALDKNPAK